MDHLHSFTTGVLLVRPTKIAGEWISPVASKKATEKVEAVEAMALEWPCLGLEMTSEIESLRKYR